MGNIEFNEGLYLREVIISYYSYIRIGIRNASTRDELRQILNQTPLNNYL